MILKGLADTRTLREKETEITRKDLEETEAFQRSIDKGVYDVPRKV